MPTYKKRLLKFQLAPNPAKDRLTIVNSFPQNGKLLFRVFTSEGKLIQENTSTKSQPVVVFTLPINTLANGAYFLQVLLDGKAIGSKYFLKY
ncbi:MAG: T9SS type A sorting domain-containing protein [Chitinophagaceae bacterium]|nr:T9SS type A sorting domain-containing protein [Chitinophagaceae bacterium]